MTNEPLVVNGDDVTEADTDALAELIEVLLEVDLLSPLAKLNETTMADNNGGRIEL